MITCFTVVLTALHIHSTGADLVIEQVSLRLRRPHSAEHFRETSSIPCNVFSCRSEWQLVPVLVLSLTCQKVLDILFTACTIGLLRQQFFGKHSSLRLWLFVTDSFDFLGTVAQVFVNLVESLLQDIFFRENFSHLADQSLHVLEQTILHDCAFLFGKLVL